MTEPANLSDQRKAIHESIGAAIMAWAHVEVQLNLLFIDLCGRGNDAAFSMWDRIRSFEAKLQSMNDIARRELLLDQQKSDWKMLYEHILSAYRNRNKVAHSTMLLSADGIFAIEPFFTMTSASNQRLGCAEIDALRVQFSDLDSCLVWLRLSHDADRTQRPQSSEPEPDLILRLRTEDAQKREAQQHRAQALRQYRDQNPSLKI